MFSHIQFLNHSYEGICVFGLPHLRERKVSKKRFAKGTRSAESLQIRFEPIIACFSNRGKTKYIYVSTITSKSNSLFLFPVSEAGDLLKDKIILENDDPPSPAPFVPTTYSGPKEMNMKSYSSPVKEAIKAENSSNFAFDDLEPLPSTAIPPTPPPVIKVWVR